MPTVTRETARDWLKAKAGDIRGLLLGTVAAGLATGLLTILQAGLVAGIVAAAVNNAPTGDWLPRLAILAGVVVLRAGAQWLQETAGLEAGIRVRQAARTELLDHIGRLGPARLTAYHSAGLAGRALEHIEALQGYYARFLPQLYLAIGIPALILVVVLKLDWLAAAFLLATAPLIPAFMALIGLGAERLNQQQFQALTRLAGCFLDRVRGLATLQLLGHANRSVGEVVAASDAYRRRSMRTLRVAFLSSAVLEFFAAVAIAAVAIYIGFGLLGYIELGPAADLTLFSGLFVLLLAPEFFQPLRSLAQHYHDRAAALGAAETLMEVLATPAPAAAPVPRSGIRTAGGASIELHQVRVEHPGRGTVLGPLTISIAPGRLVAVTGPSGAGKSTLLQLMAGFLSPAAGRVLIDNRLPTGHGDFAWMDQRPFLLQGTVADNLRLAAPAADTDRLWDAVALAGLSTWLRLLPAGLETTVTERGGGLSGGQAQRLALARVFLSPARLVLLDEPTAQLDRRTEQVILSSLKRLVEQGRTLIVASHHPAVHAQAERVLTLQHGRLADETCHA